MATYAIGDIQGCAETLARLLERVRFEPGADRLLFAGDIVNRGPANLEALRLVRSLGEDALTVLGNHDLALIGVARGIVGTKASATIDDVLEHPERDELVRWLAGRPLVHREGRVLLVHAGLLPAWSFDDAERLAREVEALLAPLDERSDALIARWGERLARAWPPPEPADALERAGMALQAMTLLRCCDAEGRLDFDFNGPPEDAAPGFPPWWAHRRDPAREGVVFFGHWAAGGYRMVPGGVALDSGAVWGNVLTAFRLEDKRVFKEPLADPVVRRR